MTDFGYEDSYVGQVKCVLLSRNPDAQIIDISHNIIPHNVLHGSFFLQTSWKYIPENSITLVVVDPGVGSSRDILILKKDKRIVLAPDNGVLSLVIEKFISSNDFFALDIGRFIDEIGISCISSTFHGRDIFAPLALYIAGGKAIPRIANRINEKDIKKLNIPVFDVKENSFATILHIDRFGNCILNVEQSLKDKLIPYNIFIGTEDIRVHLVDSYEKIPHGDIGILDGSQGYLELAMNQENLAEKLGLKVGDKIFLKLVKGRR